MSTVVCCARALGYGPASKLHVIAEELRAQGARIVFLGTGAAHEFARQAGTDAVVSAEPGSELAREIIESCDAVLSLMDQDSLRLARELSKPSFVVDSLFWMRDRVPEDFLASTRYWIQDFIGVRERAGETATGAIVVGPVVRPMMPSLECARDGVVVQLGGLDSPYLSADIALRYADFIVEGILRSDVLRPYGGRALVMGGRRCIDHLQRHNAGRGLRFTSLSHVAATDQLQRAAIVFTAPGLTATLECFQLAIPTFFLPPQNFSQWWILTRLRERNLAPQSFHWEDALPEHPLTERMPEAQRIPLLRDLLAHALDDDHAARAFRDALATVPSVQRSALASRQRHFFDTLGPNAVTTIATEVAALC